MLHGSIWWKSSLYCSSNFSAAWDCFKLKILNNLKMSPVYLLNPLLRNLRMLLIFLHNKQCWNNYLCVSIFASLTCYSDRVGFRNWWNCWVKGTRILLLISYLAFSLSEFPSGKWVSQCLSVTAAPRTEHNACTVSWLAEKTVDC